jgi:hypothetical protein
MSIDTLLKALMIFFARYFRLNEKWTSLKKLPEAKRIILIGILTTFSSVGFAQGALLLSLVDAGSLPPPAPEVSAKLADFASKRPDIERIIRVRIDSNALHNNVIRIQVKKDLNIDYVKKYDEAGNDSNKYYFWSGESSRNAGEASFMLNEKGVTGKLSYVVDKTPMRLSIEPLGDGTHAVKFISPNYTKPDDPPVSTGGSVERSNLELRQDPSGDASEATTTATQIDILVAYTSGAAADTTVSGGIKESIDIDIAELNASYRGSGVNIVTKLVDSFEVSMTEPTTSQTALEKFRAMADVESRRRTSGADIAVLIIRLSDFCGQAFFYPLAQDAYAVVDSGYCFESNHSMKHEIGHIHGARHNIENDSANWPYPYGHGWWHDGDIFTCLHTIMSYGIDCRDSTFPSQRVNSWSSPSYNDLGGGIRGNASKADVARLLNETASTVSSFCVKGGSCTAGIVDTAVRAIQVIINTLIL